MVQCLLRLGPGSRSSQEGGMHTSVSICVCAQTPCHPVGCQRNTTSLGQLSPLIFPRGRCLHVKWEMDLTASPTQGGRLAAPSSRPIVRGGPAGILLLHFGTHSALSPGHSQSTVVPGRGVLLGSCLALPSKGLPPAVWSHLLRGGFANSTPMAAFSSVHFCFLGCLSLE